MSDPRSLFDNDPKVLILGTLLSIMLWGGMISSVIY